MKWYNRRGSSDEDELNLTPLIDVVFVVLIMFIIIAPLLETDRIALAPSQTHKTNETEVSIDSSGIIIKVDDNNGISINNTNVMFDELLPVCKHLYGLYPDAIPKLLHDEKGHFGTYQKVKNGLEEAGFKQLDVILKVQ